MGKIKTNQSFWDETKADFHPCNLDPHIFKRYCDPSTQEFLNLIGNVEGKHILEIGCGNGEISVYLAKMGARVTAIDISLQAIENSEIMVKYNSLEPLITLKRLDAFELDKLERSFDIVVGKYILHHIEPFARFIRILGRLIADGSRGIFLENNSNNFLLMIFRKFLVGRFGIPKYGTDSEYPFEKREMDLLRERFEKVTPYYAEFVAFKLINTYIFRNSRKPVFVKLDEWIYKRWPGCHKYSYKQIIEIT